MNLDSVVPISRGSIGFILHGNGDLTLHFPPGKWQSKSTVEAVTKRLQELEQTVKRIITPYQGDGLSLDCPLPTLRGEIKPANLCYPRS